MKITVSITLPDYVYLFYQKVAEELNAQTTEEIMSNTLTICAGTLSQDILKDKLDL